jgi:peptide/nickel transport system substrate-binding protein
MGLIRLRLAIAAALVALAGMPVAGKSAAPVAHAQQGSTLRVALTQDIDSLNPFTSITAAGTELGRLMYEFLTTYSAKDQSPVPGLAQSWTSSDDKLTWTYALRSGVTWSDGRPITAADVAFTFTLMLTNEEARTANGNFVANFESVTAPDEHTVVIRTKAPQATMLALDVPIVPAHVWSSVTDISHYTNETTPVVGSGPFVLTEYRAGQFVRLKANKSYFRGAPKIDELQLVRFTNSDAAVQALRKGEVDLVNKLTPAQFGALRNEHNVALNKANGHRYYDLLLNPGAAARSGEAIGDGHPALRDVRVRQAIAQAVDGNVLVDKVLQGYGQPGAGLIPPVFADFHWAPAAGRERMFDPAMANRALDQAGYPRGGDGIRRAPDARPLTFRLFGRNDRTADAQAGEFVKRWLSDIGITVELRLVSSNQLNEITTDGSYDLAFSGWGANPDPDPVLSLHTCGQRPGPDGKGGTSESFFCDPQYDALYAEQLSEFDRPKRAEVVKQMQQRLYDQVPVVVLYYENALEAYRKDRFSGFQIQPEPGGVITQQNGYWGYYGAQPAATSAGGEPDSPLRRLRWPTALGVVLVAGIGIWQTRRHRASADERE